MSESKEYNTKFHRKIKVDKYKTASKAVDINPAMLIIPLYFCNLNIPAKGGSKNNNNNPTMFSVRNLL